MPLRHPGAWLAGLLGVAWLASQGGVLRFDPTRIDWLMMGDYAQHLFGWLFYRNAPWGLPLGTVPDLAFPLGTTVGFTDSLPWVAHLFKLASPWLPADIQYIGPWLVVCFFLQGYFGARLCALASEDPWQIALGGALFALAPPLLQQLGHDPLAAHWLILATLWIGCDPELTPAGVLWRLLATTALAAGLQPYLCLLVIGLGGAIVIDRFSPVRAVLVGTLMTALAVGLGWLNGYFSMSTPRGAGFGHFASDGLALVSAMGQSRLLPSLPWTPGQIEGFAYLGAGLLAVVLVWLVSRFVLSRLGDGARVATALWIVAGAFFVWSLGWKVRVAGQRVLDLRAVYRPVVAVAEIFRASGRLVWALFYVLVTTALLGLLRRFSGPRATLLLAAAVALQIADRPSPTIRRYVFPESHRLADPRWSLLRDYRHLVLYPPDLRDGSRRYCDAVYSDEHHFPFAYLAYRHRLTFNSGYLGRLDGRRAEAVCAALRERLLRHELDADSVYVVSPSHAADMSQGSQCAALDGHRVCVASHRQTALSRALAAPGSP